LHPSLEIVASNYPIFTILAMNSGEMEEDALVSRPSVDVEVRRLPPGAKTFFQSLAAGDPLGVAAASPLAANTRFDLAANLAALFAGLAIDITNEPFDVPLP
jgi:hypothetical protein